MARGSEDTVAANARRSLGLLKIRGDLRGQPRRDRIFAGGYRIIVAASHYSRFVAAMQARSGVGQQSLARCDDPATPHQRLFRSLRKLDDGREIFTKLVNDAVVDLSF